MYEGLNALRLGTVNSPRCATHQKQIVMQVKMAASRGPSCERGSMNVAMISIVEMAFRRRGGKLVGALAHLEPLQW